MAHWNDVRLPIDSMVMFNCYVSHYQRADRTSEHFEKKDLTWGVDLAIVIFSPSTPGSVSMARYLRSMKVGSVAHPLSFRSTVSVKNGEFPLFLWRYCNPQIKTGRWFSPNSSTGVSWSNCSVSSLGHVRNQSSSTQRNIVRYCKKQAEWWLMLEYCFRNSEICWIASESSPTNLSLKNTATPGLNRNRCATGESLANL